MVASHASKPEIKIDTKNPIRRVHVLLPLPLKGPYDYLTPQEITIMVGDFVSVPLGRRTITGVVWGEGSANLAQRVDDSRLRPIYSLLNTPRMTEVTRKFVEWLADYSCSSTGSVLRMTMSVKGALIPMRPRIAYSISNKKPKIATGTRQRVLDILADGIPLPISIIIELAAVSSGVVRGLAKEGVLHEVQLPDELEISEPHLDRSGIKLNRNQKDAAAALQDKIKEGVYSTTLLDGVTGAGKTEVYLEAVAAALARNCQVLVLVPEIGLTAQWLERFETRFGAAPLVWHSDLGAKQRRLTWQAVAQGRGKVLVGARSALFLPYTNLGLIIVDEEHDAAFKQEEGVIYHARDIAVLRGSLGKIPVILVSATPSIESQFNVEIGRYHRLHLPNRIGTAKLPEIEAIDMRADGLTGSQWLSSPMIAAMNETFSKGEQVLLFLNRRGYAPLTLCRKCGHRFQCPNCSAWLVEHRFYGRLQCHHCGFTLSKPNTCPECAIADSLVACGPGVERLSEEVDKIFPKITRMLIASDTVRGPNSAAQAIKTIAAGDISLIIGTQIIAKGHHFPLLTLVGVIDADLGLQGGDLRAAERTYQVLHQVSGRSGRAHSPGRALLQTYMPEHPVIKALVSGQRDQFMAQEKEARRIQGLPPYGRLVALIISGTDEALVASVANTFVRNAPKHQKAEVLGPAPAPLTLLRGRFRQRLLLKTQRDVNASTLARKWVDNFDCPKQVRITIDVDPYNFL